MSNPCEGASAPPLFEFSPKLKVRAISHNSTSPPAGVVIVDSGGWASLQLPVEASPASGSTSSKFAPITFAQAPSKTKTPIHARRIATSERPHDAESSAIRLDRATHGRAP